MLGELLCQHKLHVGERTAGGGLTCLPTVLGCDLQGSMGHHGVMSTAGLNHEAVATIFCLCCMQGLKDTHANVV